MTRPVPVDRHGVLMACSVCGAYAPAGVNALDGKGRVVSTRLFCLKHLPSLEQIRAGLPPVPGEAPKPKQGTLL